MSSIRIEHYQFALDDPYTPGHVIDEAEAKALNSLRAENIRNNMAKIVGVKTDTLVNGSLLSPEELSELQRQISAYSESYHFGIRLPKQRKLRGKIEIEVERVGREWVEGQERASGRELSQDELAEALAEAIQLPSVQAEARRRIIDREQIVEASMESLL